MRYMKFFIKTELTLVPDAFGICMKIKGGGFKSEGSGKIFGDVDKAIVSLNEIGRPFPNFLFFINSRNVFDVVYVGQL